MSEVIKQKELPEGWADLTLKEISTYIQRGKSPKYTEYSELPVVNQKCVRWEGIDKTHVKYIHPEQFEKWEEKRFLKEGDLLWNSTGTGTIGRATITHLKQDEKLVVDSHVTIVRPSTGIEPKYIYYWIMSPAVQNSIEEMQSGSTNQVELSKGAVESTSIPVAPPEQQKQIVAQIEQLFSHIDAGIEALNTAKQRLKQYRQSVLKAAVTGELSKEWREKNIPSIGCAEERSASIAEDALPNVSTSYEPASQLLERILQTRRQKWEEQQLGQFKTKGKLPKNDKWKNKYKEPVLTELPKIDLPSGWVLCTFDQIIIELKNGISIKPTETSGVAIFRISAVRAMSVNKEDVRYLDEDFDCKDFEIKNGDLLFTRYNGNPELVGVCGKVKGLQRKTVYPDKLMRARLVDNDFISSDYFELALNCGVSKSFIRASTKTTAGQSGIAGSDVKKCPVILPCYAEQVKIAEIVNEKLTAIRYLEKNIGFQLLKAQKTKQSILASAFSGKLTSYN